MSARLTTFIILLVQAALLLSLVACQDTIPYRSTIGAQQSPSDEDICPTGYEPKKEIDQNGVEDIVCSLIPIERPSNAVFWKDGHCICKDKKAVSSGNCAAFCSDKVTNGSETLFASFNVSDTFALGNLNAWCTAILPGQETTQQPSCELRAEDSSGAITSIEVVLKASSNSIEVRNIQSFLEEDKGYLLTLVEKTSEAKSNTVSVIKYSDNGEGPFQGPIKLAIITQYQCMRRISEVSEANQDIYHMHAFPLHFYFVTGLPPDPVPAGVPSIFCHDIFNPIYGKNDSAFWPRLNQRTGVFNLWDANDPWFTTIPDDGRTYANAAIIKKAKIYGYEIPNDKEFFIKFPWQTGPVFQTPGNGNGNNAENPIIGQYMAPYIDSSTNLSFCLNETHFTGNVPLYKAIGEVLKGNPTQGIYIAEKMPRSMEGSDGQNYSEEIDRILIAEEDLKAVWFEIVNQAPRKPSSDNVATKAIYMYYPINKANPYLPSMEQRMYRVKSLAELNGGNNNGKIVPHDKKIGCVPKF